MQLPDKDNEFDDLIRAAGEKYHASGANPDWDNMQAALDKEMPVKKNPRRKLFFFLPILILLLLGGAYMYFNKTNDQTVASKNNSQQQTPGAPADQPSSQVVDPAGEKSPNGSSEPAQSPAADANNKTADRNPAGRVVDPAAVSATTGNDAKRSTSAQNKIAARKQDKTLPGRNKRLHNKTSGHLKTSNSGGEIAENDPTDEKSGDKSLATTESKDATGASTSGILSQNNVADTGDSKKTTEKTSATQSDTLKNKNQTVAANTPSAKKATPAAKRKNRFEFSLLYAPELTTVGFSYIDKPGSNYGLLVGYQISDNITIQTGVIKSKKNYIAEGSDFVLRRPLPPGNKLYKVGGYCMMYEIPLNIKGQILKRKTFNLFYTAGISSYIMTSEFYNYYYTTPYGDSSRNAKFNTQNNYWLSVATAGVGFEKNITDKINFGVMPFVKIPFKGMGRGSLKLVGTGINFSLTYRPNFHK